MDLAVGLATALATVLLITFAVIRFSGLARRITVRVIFLGALRSTLTWFAAAVVFGATELLPQWQEPFSRGIASAIAGYGLNPGLVQVANFRPVLRLTNDIDREIRESSQWDDPWTLRRDAERIAGSYTPWCLTQIYEYFLAYDLRLDRGLARERAAELLSLLDDSVPFADQISVILRKVKLWGAAGWPSGRTVDGFIMNIRAHGTRRLWRNRMRRLVGRQPVYIERASDVIA